MGEWRRKKGGEEEGECVERRKRKRWKSEMERKKIKKRDERGGRIKKEERGGRRVKEERERE